MLKEYIWFFPLIFIFHDMEEKIGFGMWLKNKKDTLEKKCPSMLNSHKDFSTEGFSFYINYSKQSVVGWRIMHYHRNCYCNS